MSKDLTTSKGNYWEYRILRSYDIIEDEYYQSIHEVFITDGNILTWTERPVAVTGDSFVGVEQVLEQMSTALKKPILTEKEIDGETVLVEDTRQVKTNG